MKASQTLALRLSELRVAINDFDTDTGDTAELDKLTAEYRQKESEYRQAVISEDSESAISRNEGDGEGAEMRRMKRDADFGNYLAASAGRRAVDGLELELNQALGSESSAFPWTCWTKGGRH